MTATPLDVREDGDLVVPPPPPLVDPLPPPPAGPRREGPAGRLRPLSAAGRRVRLVGTEGDGVGEVWLHPLRAMRDLHLEARALDGEDGLRAASVVVTPGGFERVLGPEPGLVERAVAAAVLPAAVLEWRAEAAALELALSWVCDLRRAPPHAPSGGLRWRREGPTLVASGEAEVVFAVSDRGARWRVTPLGEGDAGGPALRVELRARLEPGASLRLLVAGGADSAEQARVLAGLRWTGDLVHARAAGAARLRRQRLRMSVPGEPAVADALEWAAHGLDAARLDVPGVGRALTADASWPAGGAAWGAIAGLGLGDGETAREAFLFLGAHQDAGGRVPDGLRASGPLHYDTPASTPLYLLLAARILAWTGDRSLLAAEWPRVEAALRHARGALPRAPSGADDGHRRAAVDDDLGLRALLELAVTAEELGHVATAAELRSGMSEDTDAAGAPPAGNAARGSAPPRQLGRSAPANPHDPDDEDPRALLLDPETARHEGLGARYTPATDAADALDPAAALRVAAWAMAGILGAQADAPRHRLELRPRLPGEWAGLDVTGLRMGDASIELSYRRQAGTHILLLEQVGGAVPVRVVLAPEVEGALRGARVDGRAAELIPRPAGGRTAAPVQIVLDAPRRVEVETA
ncbi:MAG TPA: hypothetical protein VMK65_11445 [Longimicrobiales bacterium]|nr:hypothetical protein [Longimicrobiales bacterium]